MRKCTAVCLAIGGGFLAWGNTARATITAVSTGQIAAWSGTPVFDTGTGPETNSGGSSQDNDTWGASGTIGGIKGLGSLAETFTVPTAGTVQNFQVVMAGPPGGLRRVTLRSGDRGRLQRRHRGRLPGSPRPIELCPDDLISSPDRSAIAR